MEKELPYEFKNLLNWREKNEAKIAALNKKIEDLQNIKKNQPLKAYHRCPYPVITKVSSGWSSFREKELISPEKINELLILNEKIDEENQVTCEANKVAKGLALDFMASLGIPDKEVVKSKKIVKDYQPAAWVRQLDSYFIISSNFSYRAAQDGLRSGLQQIEDHRAKIRNEEIRLEEEAKKKNSEEEKIAFFIQLGLKYKISGQSPIPTYKELYEGMERYRKSFSNSDDYHPDFARDLDKLTNY